jgi:hypothetical protein
MNEVFKDQNGNNSSKRVAGFIIAMVGVLIGIALAIFSFVKKAADTQTIIEVVKMLVFAGSGLLGISVVEFLGSKK